VRVRVRWCVCGRQCLSTVFLQTYVAPNDSYGFHPLKLCPSYMDPEAFQQVCLHTPSNLCRIGLAELMRVCRASCAACVIRRVCVCGVCRVVRVAGEGRLLGRHQPRDGPQWHAARLSRHAPASPERPQQLGNFQLQPPRFLPPPPLPRVALLCVCGRKCACVSCVRVSCVSCVVSQSSSPFLLRPVVVQRSGLFWRNRRLLFEIPIRGPQILISAYHSANHRATI
jgi:hypothetical protein